MSMSSSRSCGSSFTSVKGLFPEPKVSMESHRTGDDASDEVELGNRE